jgi:hypothetical protein
MSTYEKEEGRGHGKLWFAIALALGAALVALAFIFDGSQNDGRAADKGGAASYSADLEERIAELEATVARKKERKVEVTIEGQMNKAVAAYKIGDEQDVRVIENPASESYVAVKVTGKFRPGWEAGGVIEIGQGKTGLELYPDPGLGTDNDIYTRQSFFLLSTPGGKVSVGLQSMATDDLVVPGVANTDAATKRLTLGPLHYAFIPVGPTTNVALDLEIFNGEKADSIKYDSGKLLGVFSVSAAWSDDDSWDAAVRAGGDVMGFTVLASVGYEADKSFDPLTPFGIDIETKTTSANVAVKHHATGLFVQGSAARLEIDGVDDIDAWHAQAGIEQRLLEGVGPTTIWGEYSDWAEGDLTFYGVGVNQNVGGAIDIYALARRYEAFSEEADTFMAGARVRF